MLFRESTLIIPLGALAARGEASPSIMISVHHNKRLNDEIDLHQQHSNLRVSSLGSLLITRQESVLWNSDVRQ
jgi:hypothetical protein